MTVDQFVNNFQRVMYASGVGKSELEAIIGSQAGKLSARTNSRNLLVKHVFAVADLIGIHPSKFFDEDYVKNLELQEINSKIAELEHRKNEIVKNGRI